MSTKHGMARRNSKVGSYLSWTNMRSRCLNENVAHYENYGGRGIKICDRWLESYQNFFDDMGDRPEGMSLDRIDCDGNYEPSNCRWADNYTQQQNTRKSRHRRQRLISIDGIEKTIDEWCDFVGVSYGTIQSRCFQWKMPVEQVFADAAASPGLKNKHTEESVWMRSGNPLDAIGRQYSRLTVVEFVGRQPKRGLVYLCNCSCGAQKVATYRHLKIGDTQSCGCLQREAARLTSTAQNERRRMEKANA